VEPLPPLPLTPTEAELEGEAEAADEEIVGIHDGHLFIRDPHDRFRLYPGGALRFDFRSTPGAPDLPAAAGASALDPHFAVRRVRLELSGEMFERLAFTMGLELGGGRLGDTTYAGPATSRFAPALAHDGRIRPAEISLSYRFRDWLAFTLGQYNAPFSMSNRTRESVTPLMERPLPIQGFVVPNEKELGLTVWGELFDPMALAYEVGVFGGDGQDRPAVDARVDVMARVFARPLSHAGDSTFHRQAQIGLSARHGERDQTRVGYDYPALATGQGFVLWQPGYVDSLGRATHVVPSGAQNAIGGELRLPFDIGSRALDLQAELYYLVNNTREAVDGFVLTNTERFGRVKGLGWYAQISFWACGDTFVSGAPGMHRPVHVDLGRDAPELRGLEVIALAGGVNANYSGATREGSTADPNTPDANIAAYQFGGALQFWYTQAHRLAINYMAYFVPDAGDPRANQALVADNLPDVDNAVGDGTVQHELGARWAITF
jgi:hypothetical protein